MCYLTYAFMISAGYLLYTRASLKAWLGFTVPYLLLMTIYSSLHLGGIVLLWVLLGFPLLIAGYPDLRKQLITKYAFAFAKKQLPPISPSEREALEAGTVTWDGELFTGNPNWKALFAYKPAKLSDEERKFMDGPIESLGPTKYTNWDLWHKDLSYRKDLVKFAKDNGLFGMITPKKFAGKEFSATGTWQVILKLGGRLGPVGTWVLIANSIGAGELIERYGTEKQKKHYLPRLASGEEMGCFALTSPIAGSDATSIEDNGVVCKGKYEGKMVLGVKLNFNKRYITLGCDATLITLAFKLFDPDHLLGKKENIGVTIGLVPSKLKGVVHGRRHYPIGAAFPNGPVHGKDVFIPIDMILGGKEGVGKAWEMLTQALATGRATSLPTGAVAISKHSLYTTAVYCGVRKQFGLTIGQFESVQEKLAEMAGFCYLTDAMRLMTFSQIQNGERPAIPAAMSKYFSTELSRQCAIHAIDLQGGKGVMNGPKNMSADAYATAPVGVTVEGSNTMTRGLIVFGQGAIRCHPYILKEMETLEKNDEDAFDKLLVGHMNFTICNHFRSLILSLTNGLIARVPLYHGLMKRYLKKITWMSARFTLLADLCLMILGGKLKRKEALSGRFADVFSLLYMSSAAIKHFHDKKYSPELLAVVEWSLQWALNKAEQNLFEIIQNIPNVFLRCWAKLFIFPLGRRIAKPMDRLTLEVGSLVQSSRSLRESLAEGIHLAHSGNTVFAELEEALAFSQKAHPINRRIQEGVKAGTVQGYTYVDQVNSAVKSKIITKEEYKLLLEAHNSIMNIINVDDFSFEELHQQK